MIDPRTPALAFKCWSCGEKIEVEAKDRNVVCEECSAMYEVKASVVMTMPPTEADMSKHTMNGPTCEKIASSFHLWGEYIDPMATMTEAEFDAMTVEERVAQIHETFPGECTCES